MDREFLDKNPDLVAKIREMNREQLRDLRRRTTAKSKAAKSKSRKSAAAVSARKDVRRVEKH